MIDDEEALTTSLKVLTINNDARKYGTFAEIGAGQEVAREFVHAGKASGTIAKSIASYDTVCSDAIYGSAPNHVSQERLRLMLDCEYRYLIERLGPICADQTSFFVFANTVATSNNNGSNEAHGWMGVRFQCEPEGESSEIVLHLRMRGREASLQRRIVGIVGVNLINGAFYYRDELRRLIESLQDDLEPDRMEIDVLRVSGPHFKSVDNRLMALHLLECGVAIGIEELLALFNEKGHRHLEGGILESLGKLFMNAVKLYVGIVGFDTGAVNIVPRDVLRRIGTHDRTREEMAPGSLAQGITRRAPYGFEDDAVAPRSAQVGTSGAV